jgi:hypothetical protein
MKAVFAVACLCLLTASPVWAVDAFDRPTLRALQQAVKEAEPLEGLSSGQAAELEVLGAGVTSPCIIVKTDQGNWAKALVGWGLRKGEGKPVPVLMLERYVTYDSGRPGQTVAAGKDVMLFAGFGFNFDIGQVVPAKQGADVEFAADRRLTPAGEAEMYGLDGKLLAQQEPQRRIDPNDHQGVLARDFSGLWKLNADGRWQGLLELIVEDDGSVDGQYLSNETKSTYPIVGKVDNPAHRMILEIELVNSVQSFEAFLWTTDKSTMAGTTTMADRKFGFYAVRSDEAKPAGEDEEAEPVEKPNADEPEPAGDETESTAGTDEPAESPGDEPSENEPCSCEGPAESGESENAEAGDDEGSQQGDESDASEERNATEAEEDGGDITEPSGEANSSETDDAAE